MQQRVECWLLNFNTPHLNDLNVGNEKLYYCWEGKKKRDINKKLTFNSIACFSIFKDLFWNRKLSLARHISVSQ